jgi:hypothetical protein
MNEIDEIIKKAAKESAWHTIGNNSSERWRIYERYKSLIYSIMDKSAADQPEINLAIYRLAKEIKV